jgi:hypothetical protein
MTAIILHRHKVSKIMLLFIVSRKSVNRRRKILNYGDETSEFYCLLQHTQNGVFVTSDRNLRNVIL